MNQKRLDIKAVLADSRLRKTLITGIIIATQAREEITTTQQQANEVYDAVQQEKEDLCSFGNRIKKPHSSER